MKFILLSLLFAVSLFCVEQFDSYEKGLEYIKKNNKTLLVVVEQDYCPWCERFKRVLKEERVAKVLDEKFAIVLLNNANTIPKEFRAEIAPYSYIVDKSGEILLEIMGYVNEKKLLMEIELAFEEL